MVASTLQAADHPFKNTDDNIWRMEENLTKVELRITDVERIGLSNWWKFQGTLTYYVKIDGDWEVSEPPITITKNKGRVEHNNGKNRCRIRVNLTGGRKIKGVYHPGRTAGRGDDRVSVRTFTPQSLVAGPAKQAQQANKPGQQSKKQSRQSKKQDHRKSHPCEEEPDDDILGEEGL
jgi:hypothetical protein